MNFVANISKASIFEPPKAYMLNDGTEGICIKLSVTLSSIKRDDKWEYVSQNITVFCKKQEGSYYPIRFLDMLNSCSKENRLICDCTVKISSIKKTISRDGKEFINISSELMFINSLFPVKKLDNHASISPIGHSVNDGCDSKTNFGYDSGSDNSSIPDIW